MNRIIFLVFLVCSSLPVACSKKAEGEPSRSRAGKAEFQAAETPQSNLTPAVGVRDNGVTGEQYSNEQDAAFSRLSGSGTTADGMRAAQAWWARPDMGRRFLAADASLHAQLHDLKPVMGQAIRRAKLWDSLATPWEVRHKFKLGSIGSVIRDHEGRYRMYYELLLDNERRATAVAFSDDGLHWDKPSLNLVPKLLDESDSNLIQLDVPSDLPGVGLLEGRWYRGASVFHDVQTTDPGGRYKLLWRNGHDIYVATSSDGLRFRTRGRAVSHFADTMASAFHDPFAGGYAIYGRHWFDREGRSTIQDKLGADGKYPVRRGVVVHLSPSWEQNPWPQRTVRQIVIDPMNVFDDGGWADIYTPNVSVYHGQFVGLPSVYFRKPKPDRSNTTGPIYPVFMHSHDGRFWAFPDKTHPIVRLDDASGTQTDPSAFGQMYPAGTMITKDNELLIYYFQTPRQHHESSARSSYYMAAMRIDGFCSLRSEKGQAGTWLTPPVKVPTSAQSLHVNARMSGSLVVDVLDAATGTVLEGLSQDQCQPFAGDRTDSTIYWKSVPFSRAADRTVRLRMRVVDGDLFSFWFQ